MSSVRLPSTLRTSLQSAAALAVVACLVAGIIARPAAQTGPSRSKRVTDDVRPLQRATPVERTIALGESHTYELTLGGGDFVHIVIDQAGMDVAAILVGPDGREVLSVDAFDDPFRQEVLVATVDVAGRYTVVVRPPSDAELKGNYRIRVEAQRPAAAGDDVRVDAERAFARGLAVRARDRANTWPDALGHFGDALDRYRQLGDRAGELKVLVEIGVTHYYGANPEALATAEQALRIARDLGDRAVIARILRLLGNVHVFRGDFPNAIATLDESNEISRQLANARGEARSLGELGIVYRRLGDLEKAIQIYERTVALSRQSNDQLNEASALNNLGVAYKLLGSNERALKVYEESLANAKRRNDILGQITVLVNIGNLARVQGDYARAVAVHREALALSRQSGLAQREASALGALGFTFHALGDYEQALRHHQESAEMRRRIGDVSGEAIALEGAGRDLVGLGRAEEAIASIQQALAIHRNLRADDGQSDSLQALAIAEKARGNTADAIAHIGKALALEERLRERIITPELRASYESATLDKYELFVDLLQERHGEDPSGGYDAGALQVSERARARVFMESLFEARVDLREGIEPALLDRERTLQKQMADASSLLSRTIVRKAPESEQTAATRRLEEISARYQDVQRDIRQQSPRYAALTQPVPLTAAQIQRDVLDDGTVLLEFALGTERSWLWAVTAETLTAVELPPRRTLEAAARSLYEHFTARQPRGTESHAAYVARVASADRRVRDESARMSQTLFGGIADRLDGVWRGKRLVIVASGALEYLPFAALPIPRSGDRAASRQDEIPLIARHEVVEVPSASALATLRREAAERTAPSPTIAVMADPVFEPIDPRVPTARRAADNPGTRSGFARLPFSRAEANAITALAGDRAMTATDFAASRATALGTAVQRARIVHFATHGIVDEAHPNLSGLILSLVDASGNPQNGFLRLHDIYNMRLNADLVVLSACQTALGKEVKSEGLVGLTRGFMYAGAPRVVASLWAVSDAATAELMRRFYAGLLQQRQRPAAALREAQLSMARDERWASPYFWAGFVIQGEWR